MLIRLWFCVHFLNAFRSTRVHCWSKYTSLFTDILTQWPIMSHLSNSVGLREDVFFFFYLKNIQEFIFFRVAMCSCYNKYKCDSFNGVSCLLCNWVTQMWRKTPQINKHTAETQSQCLISSHLMQIYSFKHCYQNARLILILKRCWLYITELVSWGSRFVFKNKSFVSIYACSQPGGNRWL